MPNLPLEMLNGAELLQDIQLRHPLEPLNAFAAWWFLLFPRSRITSTRFFAYQTIYSEDELDTLSFVDVTKEEDRGDATKIFCELLE